MSTIDPATPNDSRAAEVLARMVDLLEPLTPSDRTRVIASTMILLGQPISSHETSPPIPTASQPTAFTEVGDGISPKAGHWMNKNSITREVLDQVFAIEDGSVEVIATDMPSSTRSKKTVEAYICCGLASFFASGDPSFTDDKARELCLKLGCYDDTNHTRSVSNLGNYVTGSKSSGWKLTNPGLTKGAEIVRLIVSE